MKQDKIKITLDLTVEYDEDRTKEDVANWLKAYVDIVIPYGEKTDIVIRYFNVSVE